MRYISGSRPYDRLVSVLVEAQVEMLSLFIVEGEFQTLYLYTYEFDTSWKKVLDE